ncbi:centrosomal protein of 85 kDa-like isoform X3 [Pelobates fuscus]|uniref:centrosomal protein of 85 kDa-like isoform X3 n=1 Tax=Pelobates fuscus TaxID=191477 RepID=UPI002FE4F4B7
MKKSSSDYPSTGWLPGTDALWHTSTAPSTGRSNHVRRLSITSDSGDTGIGTSCSDSLEDHSTSSATSMFKPVNSMVCLPTAHVIPSTARSSLPRHRDEMLDTTHWDSSYSLLGGNRNYGLSETPLDMKDSRPMKKWSSLSKLSSADSLSQDGRVDKSSSRHSLERLGRDSAMSQQSRGHRPACLHHSIEALKLDDKDLDKKQILGIDCKYKYDSCSSNDFTSSASRRHTLDMTYSALPESKPSPVSDVYGQKCSHFGYQGGVPLQSSVRTQMWLTEQLHANSQDRRTAEGTGGLSSWHPLEHLHSDTTEHIQVGSSSSRPVYSAMPQSQDLAKWESLMKIKEGLLRQKEIVIDSCGPGSPTQSVLSDSCREDQQKQQICHLQHAIRSNELRTHQVIGNSVTNGEGGYLHGLKGSLCESKSLQKTTPDRTKPLQRDREDLENKLAYDSEFSQLGEVLKQSAGKSSEDIKKLEEKIRTRDKYISSLRKKCQKENEQNREKQRRIETLEKYLADLPTLDDVHKQTERLQVLEDENKQLKETTKSLEKFLSDTRAQCQEKEAETERQKQREKELVLTVQSLQQKVEKCLEDGVRLPMLDTKQLQSENDHLREQIERTNKVIDNQQNQIENMAAEIQCLKEKLLQEQSCALGPKKSTACAGQLEELFLENQKLKEENSRMTRQVEELWTSRQPLSEKVPVADQLFKEMSHCLFDLKALFSILNQRVQGKEPNLSLLLGIGSLNCSSEETEACHSTESIAKKLSEARQLRKDIDDLRTTLSDCYAQDMGDNCITQ